MKKVCFYGSETNIWIQKEDGMHFARTGKEYTIEVYGYSSLNLISLLNRIIGSMHLGGIWEADRHFPFGTEYYPTSEIYITPKLFVDATCGKIDNDYELTTTIYTDPNDKKVIP